MSFDEDILTLIPQKPPFLMVDRLVYSDDNITRTSFVIPAENLLVVDGKFTAAGLMENIAQTAAAGQGNLARIENRPIDIGFIDSVKDLEIFALPQIGDELLTEVKFETRLLNAAIVTGKVYCCEKLMAQCEMKIFISKPNE
jgi:predicted hotdog family 3-hydroxylacyl-ACP dehydratase